jgi:hypothetical protein
MFQRASVQLQRSFSGREKLINKIRQLEISFEIPLNKNPDLKKEISDGEGSCVSLRRCDKCETQAEACGYFFERA